ncbi:MAG: hypothetical protein ACI87O_000412 [Planctomycetota bacterium]|jgi:hypothetical protein
MTNAELEQTRSTGAILASSLGLLLIFWLFLTAGKASSPVIELQEVLGELEVVAQPSHGMQILALEKLGDGRMLALMGDPEDLPTEKEMGEEKGMDDEGRGMGGGRGGGGGFGGGEPDPNSLWPKVPMGETGQAPWQAALVHYPGSKSAARILAKEFGYLDFKDLSTLPKHGGGTVVDSGHVSWNGFRLPFVRMRHFRMDDKTPVFHDSMRINMTRERHALVLYLRWRQGQLAEVETARPLLDSWTLPQ